jgi:S-DNA-T family DNA segregation ATPase FtsK/SpoIIIE
MSRFFKKFRQDVVGIFLLGMAVFVGLSLFSYSPTDPSFNSIGHGLVVTNFCGYVGSFLADALYQLFGVAAWAWVFGLLRLCVISFEGGTFSVKNVRLLWATLLILCTSALVSVYWPESRIFQKQIFLGGILGNGLSEILIKAFNKVGVQILLWSCTAVLIVFISEKRVAELSRLPRIAAAALMSWVRGLELWKSRPKTKKLKVEEAKKASYKAEDKEKAASLAPPTPRPALQLSMLPELAPDEDSVDNSEDIASDGTKPQRRKVVMKAKVSRRIENWELPKLSMLEDPPATRFKVDEKEIRRKADTLTEKLGKFGVTGSVVAAKPGPAVTMFEYKPDADVRVSKITELEDDLSLALASESLRILAPIPGRDVVGIETSNAQREMVYLKDLLADEQFWSEDMKLPLSLGKTVNGESKIVDLRKMPHLMVAGTTGSGKSVFTVSAITGLLFKHSPKTLRLILVDPKQVDLAAFDKIPHLAMPIVTDTRQAVNALKWAVREMEKRYRSMNRFGARKLEDYNEASSNLNKEQIEEHEKQNQEMEQTPGKKNDQYYFSPLPYIVIVVEEFGDLMSVDKNNVEAAVVRLAQMARACGIHLILAMQSPRKEVVTGLIKTNIPGRISFKVNSSMDSRIILDETGADRLLAQGDMLFKAPNGSNLIRHHGPFLKDSEINAVARFWADQAEPEFDSTAMKAMEASGGTEGGGEFGGGGEADGEYDERYDEILSWASAQKEISASLIQRRFALGYPRAARIIETFEREGVVGPSNGSKPRQVLVTAYQE